MKNDNVTVKFDPYAMSSYERELYTEMNSPKTPACRTHFAAARGNGSGFLLAVICLVVATFAYNIGRETVDEQMQQMLTNPAMYRHSLDNNINQRQHWLTVHASHEDQVRMLEHVGEWETCSFEDRSIPMHFKWACRMVVRHPTFVVGFIVAFLLAVAGRRIGYWKHECTIQGEQVVRFMSLLNERDYQS